MPSAYWLIKSEPESYSWDQLVADGKTAWTGVRNYQARIFLGSMAVGDEVLFYHSVSDKKVVGVARVSRSAFPDITAEKDPVAKKKGWIAVEIVPVKKLSAPIALETIKSDPVLKEMHLVKQSRLSVMPVTAQQWKRMHQLAK